MQCLVRTDEAGVFKDSGCTGNPVVEIIAVFAEQVSSCRNFIIDNFGDDFIFKGGNDLLLRYAKRDLV